MPYERLFFRGGQGMASVAFLRLGSDAVYSVAKRGFGDVVELCSALVR